MTGSVPALLLDTCAIMNLSYCTPVAAVFRSRYEGRAGWVRATHAELVRQRGRRPPHPQAGRASNWAATWLGMPIEMTEEKLLIATESIQRDIARRLAIGGGDGLSSGEKTRTRSIVGG
jgi:hypothetical protein